MKLFRPRLLIWLLVLAGAALLRALDLGWSLPAVEEEAFPMKKAFEMWGWAEGALRLDPETAGWPSFSFYAHLLLQHLQVGVGMLRGAFDDSLDFFVAYQLDPSRTVLWARSLGVAASLGVIAVALRLGRRLAGDFGALLSGGLLALSPLFVLHAQMITPDILLTFFAAMAVWFILRIGETGRTRDYVWAAVFIGLGTATKYTPILLAPSLYLVHLHFLRSQGRSLRWGGLDDRRLGWAALVTVLCFCVASPYTFADLHVLRRDFAYQMLHMQRGHFGHAAQGPGYLYYVTQVLGPGLGWPALIAGAVGLTVAAVRLRGAWLHLALCAAPLFLILGSLSTRFDRYMLPLLLPLSLGCAAWKPLLESRPSARRFMRPAVLSAVALLLLVAPARGWWKHHQLQERPSTQQLAAEWLQANAPAESTTFATEHYGPHLADDQRQELRASGVFERLDEEQRGRLLERPYYRHQYLPLYSTRVELSAFYYDLRHLLAHDYVITSGAVRRRYEAEPERFPRQVQFYRDLDRTAELAAHFGGPDGARGPEIRIYRITDETRRRLVAERGALEPDFHHAWLDKVHRPHFLGFLEGVAAHATERGRFEQSALFYGALLEVAPEQEQDFILERVAYARLRNGELERARTLYENLLRRDPDSGVALGNLGYVHEKLGDPDTARRYYRRCIEEGDSDSGRRWARQRLEGLAP